MSGKQAKPKNKEKHGGMPDRGDKKSMSFMKRIIHAVTPHGSPRSSQPGDKKTEKQPKTRANGARLGRHITEDMNPEEHTHSFLEFEPPSMDEAVAASLSLQRFMKDREDMNPENPETPPS